MNVNVLMLYSLNMENILCVNVFMQDSCVQYGAECICSRARAVNKCEIECI